MASSLRQRHQGGTWGHQFIGAAEVAMCISLAAAPLTAWAQAVVLVEPRIDAGTVQKGPVLTRDFVVRNTGTVDLVITDVKPGCTCAKATFDQKIKPGSEGKITLSVETKTFNGKISKSAKVLTNDPATPSTDIYLDAYVKPPVSVLPNGFIRIQQEAGTEATQEVTLSSDYPGFRPTKVTAPAPYLKAVLTPGSGPTEWKLSVTSDATAPEGLLGGSIKVSTGVAEQPEVSIAISGLVRRKGASAAPTSTASTSSGPKMTNQQVIELATGGLSEEVIVNSVNQASGADFDITPTGLLALKKAGVSDKVIAAMQNRRSAEAAAPPSASVQKPPSAASPCSGIEAMGIFKNEIFNAAMGGGVVEWLAKLRNNTGVTKIVVYSYRDQYGSEQQGQVQIRGGDIASVRIDMSQARLIAPVANLRLVSCQ